MIEKRKYDWRNVAKVHTQRTPIEYRAVIHCTTGTALASLSFGRYSCLLVFLCPLISRSSLLATSLRRRFSLFLRWYSITDPGAEKSGIRALHNARLCTVLWSRNVHQVLHFSKSSPIFSQMLPNRWFFAANSTETCRNFFKQILKPEFREILNHFQNSMNFISEQVCFNFRSWNL